MSYLVAAVAVAAAILVAWRYPDRTQAALSRILLARRIIFGLFALMTALILLGTGNVILVAVGIAVLVLFALVGWFQWVQGRDIVTGFR